MEPIYSYVKGSGWIIQSGVELQLHDGPVVFEFRKPNEGERFSYFETQEELDDYLIGVKNNPRGYRIEYYSVWGDWREGSEYTHFLTLVPLAG